MGDPLDNTVRDCVWDGEGCIVCRAVSWWICMREAVNHRYVIAFRISSRPYDKCAACPATDVRAEGETKNAGRGASLPVDPAE